MTWGVGRVEILKLEGGPYLSNERASMSGGIGNDILAVLKSISISISLKEKLIYELLRSTRNVDRDSVRPLRLEVLPVCPICVAESRSFAIITEISNTEIRTGQPCKSTNLKEHKSFMIRKVRTTLLNSVLITLRKSELRTTVTHIRATSAILAYASNIPIAREI